MTSPSYYDDNFGHWDPERMEDPDAQEYYHQVQAESIWKRCVGCGGLFKLRPEYHICNNCCEKVECGMDLDDPVLLDPKIDMELQVRIAKQGVEDAIRALDIIKRQVKRDDDRRGSEDEENEEGDLLQ